MRQSQGTAQIERLIGSGAWTDAALAMIDLELPQWRLRRIAYDEGEWHCALSQQRELPDWLDQTIEAHHADLPLAILERVRRRAAHPCITEPDERSRFIPAASRMPLLPAHPDSTDTAVERVQSTRRNTHVKLVEPPPSCSTASAIVLIGKNSRGKWVAQEQNGLFGGLFVSRKDAVKYALFENGRHPETIVDVREIELDMGGYPSSAHAPAASTPARRVA